jgi:hypothetical protein
VRALGLRIEDLLLVGWNLAGVPLVVVGTLAPILSLGDEPNAGAGAVQLLAVLGAIVAIATRPIGITEQDALLAGRARLAFIGPLVGAIMFVSGSASAYLGFGVDALATGTAFIVIVVAMVFGDRLPVVDGRVRRALILPFVLISAGIFNGFAADVLDGLDVGELLASLTVDETGFGIFIVGMILAGLAFFYAALVVAPRTLVDPEPGSGCLVWPLRFALYIVSAVLGIGWLAVIAG